MRHLLRSAAVALTLSACASPDPHYYTLQSQQGPVYQHAPAVIELRRVTLAGYLDRADIVRGSEDFQLRIADGARWGEPLGDMTGRILTSDLTQRLPNSTIYANAGAITLPPDARVEIDVLHFDAGANGTVTLDLTYAILIGDSRIARHQIFTAASPASTLQGQAAAMSAALAQAADAIAGSLSR